MYKLFIDDERYPVTPDWMIARTSYDAIYMVTNYGMPHTIAFDHDLGERDTAIIFIRWLEGKLVDNEVKFPDNFTYTVHSQNPVGAKNITLSMQELLEYFGGNNGT